MPRQPSDSLAPERPRHRHGEADGRPNLECFQPVAQRAARQLAVAPKTAPRFEAVAAPRVAAEFRPGPDGKEQRESNLRLKRVERPPFVRADFQLQTCGSLP